MMPLLSGQAKMDRDELIIRAFRRLYEPLCGYIRKRTGDIADIEDMVQDVFMSLLSSDRIFTEHSVDKYAYTCARNRVITIDLLIRQKATKGAFDNNLNISVAVSDGETLNFKNIGALLKVTIPEGMTNVRAVSLTSSTSGMYLLPEARISN